VVEILSTVFELTRPIVKYIVCPNHALEPTAASGLRRLAVSSALRASAAAQRERSASWEAL
jgi:hypothetical protein